MTDAPGKGKIFSPGAAAAATPSRMVRGIDDLSSQEKDLALQYSTLAGAGGVLVGVLVGANAWDVRPIRVEGGIVTVVRVSDPSIVSDGTKQSVIRDYTARIATLPRFPGLRAFGEKSGSWWSKRRFYPHVLSEMGPGLVPQPIAFLYRAIGLVQLLHSVDIIHGHVAPSNLAVLDGEPILLDSAWWAFRSDNGFRQVSGLAPEIQAGFAATVASDVYGLGMIAERLGVLRSPELPEVVRRMLSREPSLRPSIDALKDVLHDYTETGVNGDSRPTRNPSSAGAGGAEKRVSKAGGEPSPTGSSARVTSKSSTPSPGGVKAGKESSLTDRPRPALATKQRKLFNRFILVATLTVLVTLAASGLWGSVFAPPPYRDWWTGNRADLQQRVAVAAALEDNRQAQEAIILSIKNNDPQPAKVNADMLRVAFLPRWYDVLTRDGKRLAFSLALLPLLPQQTLTLPPLDQAHPGVVLALTGSVGLGQKLPEIEQYPIRKFEILGSPISDAFSAIEEGAPEPLTLSAPTARALSRMFLGDFSPQVTTTLMASTREQIARDGGNRSRLFALFQALRLYPGSGQPALETLEKLPTARGLGFEWFHEGPLAGEGSGSSWKRSSAYAKVALTTGFFDTEVDRQLEDPLLLIDLVSFDNNSVREHAAKRVWQEVTGEEDRPVVEFIAGGDHAFSREQNMLLLSALRLEEDQQASFVAQWFNTQPETSGVLALLRLRTNQGPNDPWNILAARYLRTHPFESALPMLSELSQHPEPLVRALAYAKLRVSNDGERALLEERSKTEPDQALKESLNERLEDGRSAQADETAEWKTPSEGAQGKARGRRAKK